MLGCGLRRCADARVRSTYPASKHSVRARRIWLVSFGSPGGGREFGDATATDWKIDGIRAVNSKSSAAQDETATRAEFVKCALKSVNHVHEDCADRRDDGHNRSRQTQPGDPAAGCQRLLHPCNTFFKRLADCCCVHAGRFLEQ